MIATQTEDDRFTVPLYTLSEASTYLRVPRATLATWADGYEHHRRDRAVERTVKGAPIITATEAAQRGHARLPFIGIAEAYVAECLPPGWGADAAHPSLA